MPMSVPRINASGIPTKMILIVLKKPAVIASRTVSAGVSGLSAMVAPGLIQEVEAEVEPDLVGAGPEIRPQVRTGASDRRQDDDL